MKAIYINKKFYSDQWINIALHVIPATKPSSKLDWLVGDHSPLLFGGVGGGVGVSLFFATLWFE